jgi:FMN phosphatase YigB (HAD superfamily)
MKLDCILLQLFVWLFRVLVTKSSSNARTIAAGRALLTRTHPGNKTRVLVLDVDGTLYPTSGQSDDVEMQLRDNGYSFFERHIGMNSTACDLLYKEHGSILPGLPRSLWDKFCREVYDALSLYPLRVYSPSALSIPDGTGYSHHEVMLHRDALKALQTISSNGTMIVIASNSPRRHIFRVLDRLGIPRGIVSDVFSSDTLEKKVKSDPIFWKPLLEKYPIDRFELTLIDDSSRSIDTAVQLGLQTIEVNSSFPFSEGMTIDEYGIFVIHAFILCFV